MIQCMAETSRSKDARLAVIYSNENQMKRVSEIECLAFFYTTNAFIEFNPHTYRPYLMFLGEVTALDGDFPCNIGHVEFSEDARPQMNCRYDLSNDEISDLARKGLYEQGFPIPGIFVENTLEIPITCDCTVVQPDKDAKDDPPLAFVDVPSYVVTTSEASGYEINAYFTTYKSRFKIDKEDRLYTENAPKQYKPKALQGTEMDMPDVDMSIPQKRDEEAELIARIVGIVESQIPGMLSEKEKKQIEDAVEESLGNTDEIKQEVSEEKIIDQPDQTETIVEEISAKPDKPNGSDVPATEEIGDLSTDKQEIEQAAEKVTAAFDDTSITEIMQKTAAEDINDIDDDLTEDDVVQNIESAEEFMQKTRDDLERDKKEYFESNDAKTENDSNDIDASTPDEIIMEEDPEEKAEEEKAFV